MTGTESKVVVYQLPRFDNISRVAVWASTSSLTLTYEFFRDGVVSHAAIRFSSTIAYRHLAESHSTGWHTGVAYESLVEVTPSEWLIELAAAVQANQWIPSEWDLHHYLIFFEDEGAFEVAAERWTALPERIGPLSTFLDLQD